MTDINIFSFTGRITGEPRVSQTKGGTPYITFCLAINRDKKEGDKWVKSAAFHYMSVYGDRAKGIYKYLTKGTPVGVQGHIDQDIWEDASGKKNYRTVLVPEHIALLGSRNDGIENAASETEAQADEAFPEYLNPREMNTENASDTGDAIF